MLSILRERFANAPLYQRVLFILHLLIRASFVIAALLLLKFGPSGSNAIACCFGLLIAWGLYQGFVGWCIKYRARRDPAFQYGIQSISQGRAQFEVLEDGREVPSDAPLRADPFSIEQLNSRGTSWHHDWLRIHIEENTEPDSVWRKLPNTGRLSLLLDNARRGASIVGGLFLIAFFGLFAPALVMSRGLAVIVLYVATFAWVRKTRMENYSGERFADGYTQSLSWSERFATWLWRVCSCERTEVGDFVTNRKRERRTLR